MKLRGRYDDDDIIFFWKEKKERKSKVAKCRKEIFSGEKNLRVKKETKDFLLELS